MKTLRGGERKELASFGCTYPVALSGKFFLNTIFVILSLVGVRSKHLATYVKYVFHCDQFIGFDNFNDNKVL